MILEQFIYKPHADKGYVLTKTTGVDKLLNTTNLNCLKQLRPLNGSVATFLQTFFPKERVVATSKLTLVKDDYGRDAVCNHTILLCTDFLVSFLPEDSDTSKSLEPIEA